MERDLFERLAKEVCKSFKNSCKGCPFFEHRHALNKQDCEEVWKKYKEDSEHDLALWLAFQTGILNKPESHKDAAPETRREILQTAERCVCGGRELDHGTPEQSFHAIALHFTAFLESKGLLREGAKIDAADAAAMLALFKVARVAAGNFVVDSYVDACGYLACSGELAADRERGAKE